MLAASSLAGRCEYSVSSISVPVSEIEISCDCITLDFCTVYRAGNVWAVRYHAKITKPYNSGISISLSIPRCDGKTPYGVLVGTAAGTILAGNVQGRAWVTIQGSTYESHIGSVFDIEAIYVLQ